MWIDVKDLLPNVGERVLISYTAFGERIYVEGKYIGYDNIFDTADGIKAPTHWSPYVLGL